MTDAAPESPLPESEALRGVIEYHIGQGDIDQIGTDTDLIDALDAYDIAVAQLRAKLLECEGALYAAEQFIHPDVDRGPAVDGWQNTVDLVTAALLAKAARADGGGTEAQ